MGSIRGLGATGDQTHHPMENENEISILAFLSPNVWFLPRNHNTHGIHLHFRKIPNSPFLGAIAGVHLLGDNLTAKDHGGLNSDGEINADRAKGVG